MTREQPPDAARLSTMDGRPVCDVQSLVIALMAANGNPPEVIAWGERVFVRDHGWQAGQPLTYTEGLAYTVTSAIARPPERERVGELVTLL
ncbi:MAG: hypothetical protein EPO06_11640 [Burkholderiaceae bacterium]|nr:MAG: hypothetical protein EPO06_11640 [Burkholderiaceae bacterium]